MKQKVDGKGAHAPGTRAFRSIAVAALLATAAAATMPVGPAQADTAAVAAASIARGEYLVRIGGCNDCHTAGYGEAAGKVPKSQWLTGQAVGFQGPWGVSYPANLRLSVAAMTEQQWLVAARAPRLPPMPWFNLRDMSDADLVAMYRFVKSLGPAGEPMPRAVPPGVTATTPVIVFMPMAPTSTQAARR